MKLRKGLTSQIKALRQGLHWVWGLTNRRAIKEEATLINRDWNYNQTCRLAQDIHVFLHTWSGFPLFSPIWENSITHTLSLPVGMIKSNSHTSENRWRHCLLKGRHDVLSHLSVFSNFWKKFFQHKIWYLMVSKTNNLLFVWAWYRIIRPSR